MQKALKEAKVHTSWVNPHRAYDEAVARFIDAVLTPGMDDGFLASFRPVQELIGFHGMLNGLAQTLLQMTAPGVPDLYQGSELWDLSLVDPDNRRPVDFELRRRLLGELRGRSAAPGGRREAGGQLRVAADGGRAATLVPAPPATSRPAALGTLASELLENWTDGRIKLWQVHRALGARRAHPGAFTAGAYRPVEVAGAHRENAVGFVRADDNAAFLTVVPRLTVALTGQRLVPPLGEAIWDDTSLTIPGGTPGEAWRNLLTGETLTTAGPDGRATLAMADVFRILPVALLERL
jgi:(1->4)-alpha-D-glucan 1-alpha-D-glucosylmutase